MTNLPEQPTRTTANLSADEAVSTGLFQRIADIVDISRRRVVRTVNQETVTAYWHIGREIVQALQGGQAKAAYGKRLMQELSEKLGEHYGAGFSSTNLWYFRQFYLAYSAQSMSKVQPPGGLLTLATDQSNIVHPAGGLLPPVFNTDLSWSHYRVLMRVENTSARQFYESEAAQANWSRRDLERQVGSLFYERLQSSTDQAAMLAQARRDQGNTALQPMDVLKDPYILEFLDLPRQPQLQEKRLEQAIINQLQAFLLELGRAFSFVARQKRMRFDDKDFYIDLVFYNYLLKCFVLVDLKIGELSHQDIGQMDGYVRMYDTHSRLDGDNPTIGLILCSEKNAAVAHYSVLSESQQLFAAKYQFTLPTIDALQKEIERERALIDNQDSP